MQPYHLLWRNTLKCRCGCKGINIDTKVQRMVGYVSETKQNKNRTALLTETTKVRPNQIRDFPGNEALDSLFQARSDALKQFKRGVGPNIGQKTNSEHNTEKKKNKKKK